ncbi:Short-chain dehydrogenase TIC 32, chloroplastic [Cyphellophora attinorum]|uniref:Short-chain dehydrogenase TIC 32, chloroplastic n=1 Tax=Cyphellophora attinorum TaxID=1664694 RepID=A0A0N1P0R0_9EURO|nr:Short-chain dehydrogenase TIC 32, chloroplastic [Phialophora attinorum]KPI43707.1 Short-chain dehydrogenase TIC 32, chloroplastic [Phialophora attinorum]
MANFPTWTSTSTGSDVAATFSSRIQGKTVLIVGVSPNSLGEATAAAYAAHSPALLILASRSLSNAKAVAESISTHCKVECVPVDLSDYASVRDAASQIRSLTSHIDILINNAAVVKDEHTLSPTAQHELQLATTFLGPFLLTNLIMPLLLNSAQTNASESGIPTRIVNVTSAGHVLSPVRFSDPHFHRPLSDLPESEQPAAHLPASLLPGEGKTYAPFLAYGQSKTANILFSIALNKRLLEKGTRIASLAVHPGSVQTNLSRSLGPESRAMVEGTTKATGWMDMGQGSVGMLVAGLDPRLVEEVEAGKPKLSDGGKGVYLNGWRVHTEGLAKHAADEDAAERLWALAGRETGVKCDGLGSVVDIIDSQGQNEEVVGKESGLVSTVKEIKI